MVAPSVSAFPLAWPAGWPRTPAYDRKPALFGVRVSRADGAKSLETLTIGEGVDRVLEELTRLGVRQGWGDIVISTNATTGKDGLPRSSDRQPVDPACAVYWVLDGERQCMAIDIYHRLGDNLAAVAATIAAMRQIERHGGAAILKRAFQGFKLLPASTGGATMGVEAAWATLERAVGNPPGISRPWNAEEARALVRRAKNAAHPDRHGGETGAFVLVTKAGETLAAHYGGTL